MVQQFLLFFFFQEKLFKNLEIVIQQFFYFILFFFKKSCFKNLEIVIVVNQEINGTKLRHNKCWFLYIYKLTVTNFFLARTESQWVMN